MQIFDRKQHEVIAAQRTEQYGREQEECYECGMHTELTLNQESQLFHPNYLESNTNISEIGYILEPLEKFIFRYT